MSQLNDLISSNLAPITGALGAACLLLLLVALVQGRRIGRLGRRLDRLARPTDGAGSGLLDSEIQAVHRVGRDLDQLSLRTSSLETGLRRAYQRVGVVRFDAFDDTGGRQSFALALLNDAGDGFVMSSLYARSGARVFGKAVSGGRPETALSNEESQAVSIALRAPAPGTAPVDGGEGRPREPAREIRSVAGPVGRPPAASVGPRRGDDGSLDREASELPRRPTDEPLPLRWEDPGRS